jgi:predicted acyl esterase
MRIVERLPVRVREIENVWIPAGRTGQRMAARLWLPEGAEEAPVPAILTYLPYRKRDSTRAGDDPAGTSPATVRASGSTVRVGRPDGLMDDGTRRR